jgi:hypothetical protein
MPKFWQPGPNAASLRPAARRSGSGRRRHPPSESSAASSLARLSPSPPPRRVSLARRCLVVASSRPCSSFKGLSHEPRRVTQRRRRPHRSSSPPSSLAIAQASSLQRRASLARFLPRCPRVVARCGFHQFFPPFLVSYGRPQQNWSKSNVAIFDD